MDTKGRTYQRVWRFPSGEWNRGYVVVGRLAKRRYACRFTETAYSVRGRKGTGVGAPGYRKTGRRKGLHELIPLKRDGYKKGL